MEPVNNLNEQRQTQAKVTVCSHPSVGSQSSTSVGTTPVGHESSLLPPTTPEVRMLPCQQNQVSAPEEVQKFANPAPLGLCAFALTSLVSNCMNISMVSTKTPGIDTALALTYGGVVQLLAGMWEMALGNTLGATSFCSYGGYWITVAIRSELDSTQTATDAGSSVCQTETLMDLFMMAWFIFTTLMLLCALKSSVAMFLLFFLLDLNYLLLGIVDFHCNNQGDLIISIQKAGWVCGLLAALAAWYNAFAGIFDSSNGFFTIPLGHFPWAPAVRAHQVAKMKEV